MSCQSHQAAARPPRPGRRRSVAGGHRRGGGRRGGAGAKAVAAARWENRRKVNYVGCLPIKIVDLPIEITIFNGKIHYF